MALTQAEKNSIFLLIQEKKISVQRNEEIRGDEEAARAEIATYAPEILRIKQEAKNSNLNQLEGLQRELANLETDIATLESVLEDI